MDEDPVVADVQRKIERERLLIQAAVRMRAQANPSMQSSIDNQIREGRRNVEYLEGRLRELQMRRMNEGVGNMNINQSNSGAARGNGNAGRPTVTAVPSQHEQTQQGQRGAQPRGQSQQGQYAQQPSREDADYGNAASAGYSDLSNPGQLMAARPPFSAAPGVGAPKGRPNYSRLDLIKYDTPFLGPRIQLMLSQLEFKLSVEKQYEEGIVKIMGSYKMDGDRKIRQEAGQRRADSAHKIQLLQRSLKKYEDLHVDMESSDDVADDDSMNAPALRKSLTGVLSLRIHAITDVSHSASGSRFSKGPETYVALKVEDEVKARTKGTRTDRWSDEYHEIDIDKGNEIELTVYDKSGSDAPQPIGLLWIRISDIVEEMRRKKIETEINNSGWVSADRATEDGQTVRPDLQFQPPPGQRPSTANSGNFAGPGFSGAGLQPQSGPVTIDAWFSLEPVGRIQITMSFAKESRARRPFDAGLHRKGAVRQRKEEVHELYGHKFIAQQFYNIMRCALCGELLKYSTGMQCSDCHYLCHEKCYPLVVTKCITKSNAENDPDEAKINHRIPHRFETFGNVGANWCCHCGYMLPLGRKSKRCKECKLTCHAHCTHLVPDFCGMSMKDANRILSEIKKVDGSRSTPSRMVDRNLRAGGRLPVPRPAPSSTASYISSNAEARKTGPPEKHLSYEEKPSEDRSTPSLSTGSMVSSSQSSATSAPGPSDLSKAAAKHMYASNPQMLSPREQQYQQQRDQQQRRPQQGARTTSSAAAAAAADALASNGRPSERLPPQASPGRERVSQPQQQPYSRNQPIAQAPQGSSQAAYDPSAYRDVDKSYNTGMPTQPSPGKTQAQPPPPRISVDQPTPPVQQQTRPAPEQQAIAPTSITQFVEQRHGPQTAQQMRGSGKRIGLDHFNFLAVLGKGNFGKVMLAETKHSKQLYAIKVLKKEFIIENDEVESTKSERDVFIIANKARHPFLTNLHACFQTETRVYFVMEYISGGDLMLHIQRGNFGTKRAQFYAAEVCLALKYFHENGVVYRDLKLDNIMLTLDGHIKVADYGLCKKDMYYGSTTSTFCGTPEFMAPEILLDRRYGRAVDWWAFGVLIYQMLLQQSPFRGEDEDEIYDAILSDEPLYPINMPHDSVSILQKLLTREPTDRLGSGPTDAQEIMSHAFFRNINWEEIYAKKLPAPFLPQIKNATDTSNFDSEFTSVTPVLTPVNSVLSQANQEEFRGFSYSADDFA